MELNRRILSGLLVPAFLLAVWLCPCTKAEKSASSQNTSHKCCEAKTSSGNQKSPPKEDCPHCNGGPKVTTEQAKLGAIKFNLQKLLPTLVFDPLYLVQTATVTIASESSPQSLSPPIRLQTCTFLF